jgi:hypothetical protein
MLAKDRMETTLCLYNEDKSILYFSGLKKDFSNLGISTSSLYFSNSIDSDSLFLDKYILTTTKELTAIPSDMSVSEIIVMLNKEEENSKIVSGQAKKVLLLDVKNNKPLTFKSLSACAEFFRGLGYKTIGNTLRSRIETGREYNGYVVKWDEDKTTVHSRAKAVSITSMETGLTRTYTSTRADFLIYE